MRLLALVLFGLPLAVATLAEARRGNPVAIGIALGVVGPLLFMAAVVALTRILAPLAPKAVARKADPAKIARLERELLDDEAETRKMGPVERAVAPIDRSWPCAVDNQFADGCEGPHYESDGGTRRVCLRTRPATFHGAPTFGHKIEGP